MNDEMTFSGALARLSGPKMAEEFGSCIVRRSDLDQLLFHFRRVDKALRARVDADIAGDELNNKAHEEMQP